MDHARHTVEQGTDGSWLVVDYGAGGDRRVAITREIDGSAARQQANTLNTLDRRIPHGDNPPGQAADTDPDMLLAEHSATVDAAHHYNHLLP